MRNLAANLLTVLFVIGITVLAGYQLARRDVAAPGPATEPVRLTVEKGARMGEVADKLEALGAIDGAWLFRLAASYSGKADELKFGEYEIQPGASMEQILALLTTGGNVQYQVTVPEGWTTPEIVKLLEDNDFLAGEITETPAEGSLLPETYNVNRGDTRAEVIGRMQAAMQKVLDEAWETRDPDVPVEIEGAAPDAGLDRREGDDAGRAAPGRLGLRQPAAQGNEAAERPDGHLRHHAGPGTAGTRA